MSRYGNELIHHSVVSGEVYDHDGIEMAAPAGTCDSPFCRCHRAHAATAPRDYLAAVDAVSTGITEEERND